MDWKTIQSRLASDRGRWSQISRETGLHINTVRGVAIGKVPTPRIMTVEKLGEYYTRVDNETINDMHAQYAELGRRIAEASG